MRTGRLVDRSELSLSPPLSWLIHQQKIVLLE